MCRLRSTYLAFSLAFCFFFVGGVFSVQAVEHIPHHSHHKTATHATTICSWFCAASQGLESPSLVVAPPVLFLLGAANQESTEYPFLLCVSPSSRAPPVSL